jgi:methoxymalonate biosynthesis acyl carrier protein
VEIRQEIRSFIERNAIMKQEKLAFGDDDNFFELQLVSSLFAMHLVTHLEKTYRVKFQDDDLDISNFRSINAIVGFIERKRGAAATPGGQDAR